MENEAKQDAEQVSALSSYTAYSRNIQFTISPIPPAETDMDVSLPHIPWHLQATAMAFHNSRPRNALRACWNQRLQVCFHAGIPFRQPQLIETSARSTIHKALHLSLLCESAEQFSRNHDTHEVGDYGSQAGHVPTEYDADCSDNDPIVPEDRKDASDIFLPAKDLADYLQQASRTQCNPDFHGAGNVTDYHADTSEHGTILSEDNADTLRSKLCSTDKAETWRRRRLRILSKEYRHFRKRSHRKIADDNMTRGELADVSGKIPEKTEGSVEVSGGRLPGAEAGCIETRAERRVKRRKHRRSTVSSVVELTGRECGDDKWGLAPQIVL